MRIFSYLFLIAVSCIIINSCKEKEKSRLDLLYEEVIEVHDEVMPLITDMHKNETALIKYSTHEPAFSDSLRNSIKTNITNLENTVEAMMDWMYKFSKPSGKDEEEALAYLKGQKIKIRKISKAMKMTYSKSSILLNALNKKTEQ